MPDREKYIEILSKTVKTVKEYNEDAPIKISLQCVEDILELLKEQEAVEPEVEVLNEIDRLYRCPRCHKHFFYEKQKYCDECGKAVKWE